MSWAEVLAPEILPFYVATLAMLALATILLLAGKGSATRAMAAYLILFSLSAAMEVAAPSVEGHPGEALHSASMVGLLIMGLPLVWFISTWPHRRGPLTRLPHGEWFLIATGAALVVLALAFPRLLATPDFRHFGYSQAGPLLLIGIASVAAPGFVAWVLARDLQRSPHDEIRSRMVLAVAFTFYPLYRGTVSAYLWISGDIIPAPYDGRVWQVAGEVLTLAAGVLAAHGARRIIQHSHARLHKIPFGLAGLFVAAIVLGVLQVVTFQRELVNIWTTLPFALIMLFLPVTATYGLLRGGILGLDLKVRFAISKTTLAGIFIAVFFVGSETAQQFFGEKFGGPYFGIAAAGCLVFVLAPLSKVADRLAEKAVPVAIGTGPVGLASRKEQTYRDALAVAMRDRKLTSAEEVTLARLAEDLGIGAGRAMELRHEAGRKRRRGR